MWWWGPPVLFASNSHDLYVVVSCCIPISPSSFSPRCVNLADAILWPHLAPKSMFVSTCGDYSDYGSHRSTTPVAPLKLTPRRIRGPLSPRHAANNSCSRKLPSKYAKVSWNHSMSTLTKNVWGHQTGRSLKIMQSYHVLTCASRLYGYIPSLHPIVTKP